MLIAGRNAMMAGRRLPYDAEVEYLESTGKQWIATGVFHDSANKVRFKLKIPNQLGTWNGPYADYLNEQMRTTRLINNATSRGGVLLYHATIAGSGATNFKSVLLNDSSIILEGYTSPSEYSLNGVVISPVFPSVAGVATRSMKLFHKGDGPIASRFYYFRIDNQCDFIPVRFTNELGQPEGAMYDSANPTVGMNPDGSARNDGLYRNRGTGAFIIGPDVTASNGGGYKRKCVRRSYRRSLWSSARRWRAPLWKEVA